MTGKPWTAARYSSPLGTVVLATADGQALSGAWFEGQKHFAAGHPLAEGESPLLERVKVWLGDYFEGGELPLPPLAPEGTPFQRAVWDLLPDIPRGKTATYGELAGTLSRRWGRTVSPRAVGSAVGRNPISILIPCHRVVGASGSLTGYAGGLDRKEWLLRHEGAL